ncbi:SMI1/KNR4 family protein [Streptomyces stelliscabiei]|uniref:SMI1/KNR4 family protein n=1 Tax=Streptomyces stelliscabiei TaxID=146820 RepID=UPI0029A384DE|nr:SMI1/KNR4 family protein [Streptomyces stelliscabiei]MDX2551540.1 SMI1/KNR4 family protein [Streptomyces stelliscabiei]MDX2614382.1 SMI1/KNR4 family protein [Streptomyces stelliscabiei]MDX2635923.1 SMI1/KNR4 family protein [Streptomyces stelliscabiei]MDX2666535.1 SMI1/KNR4 family protein [Streptomyces stelliscabiei]MDX2713594.1 SMI1/KNR4 family protein [Streptomyces stelliscabiei]
MRKQPPPPPLTEAETSEAEQELGVSLPPEYRDYLREVSAGGALTRLERTDRGWWWAGNDEAMRARLVVPFPHPDSYDEGPTTSWPRGSRGPRRSRARRRTPTHGVPGTTRPASSRT